MAFERKKAETATTAATATAKKGSKDSSASVWVNFSLVVETKSGTKKISSGIPADNIFKKLFGEGFLEVLNDLTDEQIESITEKLSVESFSINIITPSEPASFEDLF